MCLPFLAPAAGGAGLLTSGLTAGAATTANAGLTTSLFATLFTANQQNEQGKYLDKVSKINAQSLGLQAEDALKRGTDWVRDRDWETCGE